jgi:hypothetical protein
MKMDCRQIEELMMDYLYQELDADQTSAYRAHLTTCASCGAQLAGYERTRLAVRELPDLEPPAEVTARLLQEAARRPVRAVEPVGAAATVGARGVAAAAPVEGKGVWAWLSGWMQPILAHPGFATAAAVVIVGGIAGLLAMRGKLDLSAAPQAATPVSASAPAAADESRTEQLKDSLEEKGANAPVTGGPSETAPGSATAASPPPPPVGSTRLVQPKDGEALDYAGFVDADKARRQDSQAAEKKADRNLAAPAPAPADAPRERAAAKRPMAPPSAAAELDAPSSVGALGRGGAANKEAAPVALPHETARPAKSAPAPKPSAQAESAADDESSEGSSAAGSMAGAPAPAAAAPPPAPATKAKSVAQTAQDNEAKKLHGQARMKANTGDCAAALKLRDRIYRVDPAYFERSVRNDADLGKCTARKKATESRDAKVPAPDRDEAPAVNTK